MIDFTGIGHRATAVPTMPASTDPLARDDFESMLASARREETIRQAARALTAQALVAPILRELRSNSMAWGPFRAGDAERIFGPMLDLQIADRIAASPRLGVADRLEARLRTRTGEAR